MKKRIIRNILCTALIAVLLIQCEDNKIVDTQETNPDDSLNIANEHKKPCFYPEFIVAGDTNNITGYILLEQFEFLKDGDSIPDMYAGSICGAFDKPLNIDEEENLDIRYGAHNYLTYNILIFRALYFSNNFGNEQSYEFALQKHDEIGIDNDTVHIARLFNSGDTISVNEDWHSSGNPGIMSNKFYFSYYFDYDFYKSLFTQKPDGQALFINKTGLNKYIGIRKKKPNGYIYGYIQIDFNNYDDLKITSSGFADRKRTD